ncbi:MAG: TrkH family potassium uptake protein [bacterium]
MNDRNNGIIFGILTLAITALFLEYSAYQNMAITVLINILDFAVLFLFIFDVIFRFIQSKYKLIFVKKHIFEILFLSSFAGLFFYSKYISLLVSLDKLQGLSTQIIFLVNLFIVLKIFGRLNKLSYFLNKFSKNPAQTIMASFFILILIGTLLLMMPFSTADHIRLGFINALFTATSAVCVTGLIVVDTATRFSTAGQAVILVLIQCGGLGIMLFAYFTAFLFRRQISVEEKLTLSYMLNEKDVKNIFRPVGKIIFITLSIEAIGAACFFLIFKSYSLQGIFAACFHAISAFCNAGFALFTDSLEAYKSSLSLNMTCAMLIILGGLGFSVIFNLIDYSKDMFRTRIKGRKTIIRKLNLNTRVVVLMSAVLIVAGMLIIYALEHRQNLVHYNLPTQYIAAFFQSVTLRTAGFNTISFAGLQVSTYMLMILFMFIGAASGSTGGGIKINTCAVLYGYVKSVIRNSKDVILFKQSISRDLVNRAFLVVLFALSVIFTGTFILSLVENTDFIQILFEVVSAFCTVGLSTGITSSLTMLSKLVIILIMFMGRLGPLTIIASLSQAKEFNVEYPSGYISIG